MIRVDKLFPVSLSAKSSLTTLATKLQQYGTISYISENGRIIAMCAGYTNDIETRLAYISVVATLPEYMGKGYGKVVVQKFIEKAKQAGMQAVCLYADKSNKTALHMYEKLGFRDWNVIDEPRPEDKHLIHYLL